MRVWRAPMSTLCHLCLPRRRHQHPRVVGTRSNAARQQTSPSEGLGTKLRNIIGVLCGKVVSKKPVGSARPILLSFVLFAGPSPTTPPSRSHLSMSFLTDDSLGPIRYGSRCWAPTREEAVQLACFVALHYHGLYVLPRPFVLPSAEVLKCLCPDDSASFFRCTAEGRFYEPWEPWKRPEIPHHPIICAEVF